MVGRICARIGTRLEPDLVWPHRWSRRRCAGGEGRLLGVEVVGHIHHDEAALATRRIERREFLHNLADDEAGVAEDGLVELQGEAVAHLQRELIGEALTNYRVDRGACAAGARSAYVCIQAAQQTRERR